MASAGVLEARVAAAEWQARQPEVADLATIHHGMGRELFAAFRANALGAEQGAVTFKRPSRKERLRGPRAPVHDHFVFATETRVNVLELMRIGR